MGMYIINSNAKKIKKIKEFLQIKKIEYRDAKTNEYLLIQDNPIDIFPPTLLHGIKILETKDWFRFVKEYGNLGEFLYKKEKPPEKGQRVRIISGQYGEMKLEGIIVSVGNNNCSVEVALWGKIVKISVGFEDILVLKEDDI